MSGFLQHGQGDGKRIHSLASICAIWQIYISGLKIKSMGPGIILNGISDHYHQHATVTFYIVCEVSPKVHILLPKRSVSVLMRKMNWESSF